MLGVQGGVHIFLHWFDKFFHGHDGPANWAKARLVRYADDFVVLARWQGPRLRAWVEGVLEGRMGLVVNREKTRIVKLKEEGAAFDFLGFTFGWMPDLIGWLNRHLKGWANYFDFGYPRHVFRRVNHYVRERLFRHLQRRSQRRYRAPDGKTMYEHLADLGTVYL